MSQCPCSWSTPLRISDHHTQLTRLFPYSCRKGIHWPTARLVFKAWEKSTKGAPFSMFVGGTGGLKPAEQRKERSWTVCPTTNPWMMPSSTARTPSTCAVVRLESDAQGMFKGLVSWVYWSRSVTEVRIHKCTHHLQLRFLNSSALSLKAITSVGHTKVKSRGQNKNTTYFPL